MSTLAEQLDLPPHLPTEDQLPCDDGMRMETARHRMRMELLLRGPDVYVPIGVRPGERKGWVVRQEGKAPDMVIEQLSERTAETDKGGEDVHLSRSAARARLLLVRPVFRFDPFLPQDRAGFSPAGQQLSAVLCSPESP